MLMLACPVCFCVRTNCMHSVSQCACHVAMQVLHGEIGENPLETLAVIAQDVFMPLLTSPANQEGWPDVVAKEVTDNMHKFVANGARRGATGGQCSSYLHAALCRGASITWTGAK